MNIITGDWRVALFLAAEIKDVLIARLRLIKQTSLGFSGWSKVTDGEQPITDLGWLFAKDGKIDVHFIGTIASKREEISQTKSQSLLNRTVSKIDNCKIFNSFAKQGFGIFEIFKTVFFRYDLEIPSIFETLIKT